VPVVLPSAGGVLIYVEPTRGRNVFIVARLHPCRRAVKRPRYPAGTGLSAQPGGRDHGATTFDGP
jgi:hypothetical protein